MSQPWDSCLPLLIFSSSCSLLLSFSLSLFTDFYSPPKKKFTPMMLVSCLITADFSVLIKQRYHFHDSFIKLHHSPKRVFEGPPNFLLKFCKASHVYIALCTAVQVPTAPHFFLNISSLFPQFPRASPKSIRVRSTTVISHVPDTNSCPVTVRPH